MLYLNRGTADQKPRSAQTFSFTSLFRNRSTLYDLMRGAKIQNLCNPHDMREQLHIDERETLQKQQHRTNGRSSH